MVIIVLGLISFGVACCWAWIKFVNWIFPKEKKKEPALIPQSNPYIEAQKRRNQNDHWYDEYISWMDHNGGGMPMDKVKTPEEKQFEKKYNDAHFKRWRPNK